MVENAIKLSDADRRIIRELEWNGRLRNVELAERVGMSESACIRRVRALEAAGLIMGYRAVIDRRLLGQGLSAYILVNLDQRTETDLSGFISTALADNRIRSCEAITGTHDLILWASVRDVEELGELTLGDFLQTPSVQHVTTCVVLKSFRSVDGVERPAKPLR